MAVAKKRPRMRRTQISLLPEEYELAKRMAAERGVSLSQVVRDAIRDSAESEPRSHDPLRDLIGMVKNADPDGSVKHDEMIYGEGIP